MKKIFITGASGCVGHYLFDRLVKNPDYELYLLMRNPERLKRDLTAVPNVKVVKGDLQYINEQADLLCEMDYVVHIAAGWGDEETNYDFTLKLFELANHPKLKKIIYFSTASILGEDGKPLGFIPTIDNCYINSKFNLHERLPSLSVFNKVVTLFPTWVLGGDSNHSYSHALQGIIGLKKLFWLLRFFTFDVSFHFIHAADIAQIVEYLLKNETDKKEYVLGNELISAGELIKQISAFYHQRVYFQLNIPAGLIKFLAGKKLSAWDRYCLTRKVYKYDVVTPASFGLKDQYPTIADVLAAQ